ncbi:MAG: hypothetical protein IJX16_01245, partial [Clostridia bacterium]|nr:hypothetical protein [Clostridia bacterium]
IDFKLDILKNTFDVKTVDGKRKFVTQAIRVIKESPSPAEQEDLLKTVRDLTGVTFEALKRELYSTERSANDKAVEKPPEFTDNAGDKSAVASRFVLAGYLFNKNYAKEIDIRSLKFSLPVHIEIQNFIIDKQNQNLTIKFNDLYELLSEDYSEEISRIAGLETEENKRFDENVYFFDCVRTLRLESITKEIERLSTLYNCETNTDKRRDFAKEMSALLSEKNKLQ